MTIFKLYACISVSLKACTRTLIISLAWVKLFDLYKNHNDNESALNA